MNQVVIDAEAVPVHVTVLVEVSADADRVAVGHQEIAQLLRCVEAFIVGVARLVGRFAQQWRMAGHPQHLDAVGGKADVGKPDRRSRELVHLPQTHLHLILALALTAGACDADEIRTRGGRLARQNHPHPRVHHIGRVKIAAEEGILGEALRGQRTGKGGRISGVVRSGQHGAVGPDQFDDRVQGVAGAVDVEPHLGTTIRGEAVNVHVARIVQADEAVDLEAQPPVVVAALFVVDDFPGSFGIGGQVAQEFRHAGKPVLVVARRGGRLLLQDHRHVPAIGVLTDADASPVAGGRLCGRRAARIQWIGTVAVVVGVAQKSTVQVEPGGHTIVGDGGENHGPAGHAHDVQCPADAVVDIQRHTVDGEAGPGPQLHDQAGRRVAHQLQPAERMVVEQHDLAAHHVGDVGIVPRAIGGQHRAADIQAVGPVVLEAIQANQRPAVVVELAECINRAGGSARVRDHLRL